MNFSRTLDSVVALIFIFLVLSLIVSGIHEAGARLLAAGSRLLWSSRR